MKKIRFTLAMMALVLFSITVNAQHSSFEVDGICYRLTSRVYRTVSVTYRADTCEKYAGDIVIPTAISYKDSEYKVLGITEGAFSECTELLSVTIPDEIQNIGNGAFEGCKKLSAIRIPEGVPSIGESMFKQCENLESIYIPNSVTGIGASAFAHCYNLDSITIPNSITSIGASAFANCRELNSFTVPTSVTSIGEMAFHNCYNLESLKVAEGNTVFDSRNNCNAIIRTASNTLVSACPTTVIPHDITTIGPIAFRGMSITNLVFPDGLKAIGSLAFWGSPCDKTLIIPESVESIGQGAFAYCTADSVIICGQLTSLEEDVFEGCSNLIYIDLPGSLESVNAKSFNGSINLQKIVCRAPIPPQCNSQFFVFASEFITLEVPEESLPLYKEANLWKDFYRIKAIGSDDVVEQPDSNRNVIKKGHGTYRVGEDGECTYLVSYDYNAYAAKLDSVDCIQWHNRNAIVIDADTIGPEAFASCTFADGQIIYLTERVKVICKDAFSPIYIQRSTNDFQIAYNLYLVFGGKNPPRIADNRIMDYAKNPCDVNFVVPDLEAYIKSDAQWTYTTLMTVDDLLAGQVSEENTIKVLEAVEADVVVDFDKLAPSGAPMMYATVRPPKEVPVRIGTEGDTIYSPAPVWQNYKMQVQVVNDDGRQYFGGEWRCSADEQCDLTIELYSLPDSNYVYFLSRYIASHGASSSWTRIKVQIRKEEPKTNLVTEGKQWAVYYEQSWNQEQPVVTYTFRLQGDTVINGFTYKKKWMSVEKDLSDWFLFPSYMREENGKVYVMNSRGEEALWFDYNAQVGDTLCLTSKQATQQCYGLVTSIDDVVLEHSDGKQRKRYEVVLGQEAISGGVYFTDECIYIHEDVGMFNSPTYGYGLGDHTLFNYGNKFKLLCVHDNGIALYQSPDGCYKEATSKTYLVTEGKEWAVCSHGFMPPPNHSTYTYRLQGDTIIDGKRYLKEHVSHDIHLANWKPSGRYLREENGKVYSKFKQKNEQIQLDYNMNVGDTLRYNDLTDNYRDYVYICLTGIRDTIMPNGDGVSRRCYDVDAGQYIAGTYHPCEHQTSFVEGIGWIDWGLGKQLLLTDGGWDELLYVKQGNNLLYQKEKGVWWVGDNVDHRPLKQRGYGLYHSDSYLYAYTINEAEAVTDSTDFARWYDKTVICFDVDTIGPNAFSGATFRQGQILYFTERLNTIFKDAFTDINIIKRTSQESLMSDDLTLVFAGANPPGIDKNHIMDYADSTYRINYVVPDLETYIKDDIQWTYTTLMTIDDFVQGYVSPENEVTISDTTEADACVDNAGEMAPTGPPTIRASVRPRGDIPVRIGEGENKDIYSRAPAWQRYTVEVAVTDCHANTLYTASQECRAHGQCDFVIELPHYPDGGYVYLHSRSIDMFGRATEWAVLKVQVDTAIDELLLPSITDVYYDLQGRPVASPTRGIYIRNGRKVVL